MIPRLNFFVTFSTSVIDALISLPNFREKRAFASAQKLLNYTALNMVSSTQVFRSLQKSLLRDIKSKNTFFRRKVMHRKRFFPFFLFYKRVERAGQSKTKQ